MQLQAQWEWIKIYMQRITLRCKMQLIFESTTTTKSSRTDLAAAKIYTRDQEASSYVRASCMCEPASVCVCVRRAWLQLSQSLQYSSSLLDFLLVQFASSLATSVWLFFALVVAMNVETIECVLCAVDFLCAYTNSEQS